MKRETILMIIAAHLTFALRRPVSGNVAWPGSSATVALKTHQTRTKLAKMKSGAKH